MFVISGPNTLSTIQTSNLFSTPVTAGGIASSAITQCLTDTFVVTAPGFNSPPAICGTNDNQHSKLG